VRALWRMLGLPGSDPVTWQCVGRRRETRVPVPTPHLEQPSRPHDVHAERTTRSIRAEKHPIEHQIVDVEGQFVNRGLL